MSTIEQGLAELQRRKQQGDPALQNVDLNTLGGAKSTQSNLESILQQGGQNIGVSPGRQAASNFLSVLGGGKAQFTAKATDALKPKSELEKLLERAKVAEAAQTLGNRPLFESITGQGQVSPTVSPQAEPGVEPGVEAGSGLGVDQIQAVPIDPFTKEPTQEGLRIQATNKEIEKRRLVRATKEEEQNIKREVLSKDVETFLAVDRAIPRGEGLARFGEGIKSFGASVAQQGQRGIAAATHNALRKRLRVQLVRAAGDVGNLNIIEQKAAELILPTVFDSQGVTDLKRTILKELTEAVDSRDSNRVQELINRFMSSGDYRGPQNPRGSGGPLDTGKTEGDDELNDIEARLAEIQELKGK